MKNANQESRFPAPACGGMALVTGLLMLTAVSLLAVTAAGSMTLQQHQATNFADKLQAASRAQTAGLWARAWLYSRADHERDSTCLAACTLPPAIHSAGALDDTPELRGEGWWQTHGVPAGREPATGEAIGFVSTQQGEAYWLIEEIHYEMADASSGAGGVGYYRVLSRGRGTTPGSVAVSEALIARPWGPAITAAAFPPGGPVDAFCNAAPPALDCGTLAWRRLR